MEINKIYQGDSLEVLKTLPDCSINCCVTSPPYWGLRDYGHNGQLGLESTPEEYVSKLVAIFGEVNRVLKEDGTLWLNLGDTYYGGGGGNQYSPENQGFTAKSFKTNPDYEKSAGFSYGYRNKKHEDLKPKDMVGIPWMVAFALRSCGWYLRQDIIWHKPNPMPESVTDRCTKSHEYIFLLSKSQRYYFDHNAIIEPYESELDRWGGEMKRNPQNEKYDIAQKANANSLARQRDMRPNKEGRNKRDVWTVNTASFSEAHFATFPEKLIVDMIKAGCPTDGTVLDPFMGSGTTGLVARKLNRNYVGIELNPKYIKIAEKRIFNEIGLFL
jgi:DNA modification methylase